MALSKDQLSQQAKNSLDLYAGGDESKIKQLLRFQRSSVVNELMEFTGSHNMDDLALRLKLRMY
ncbi:MAG: hypothetical protein MJZ41_09660 [Bacteroidaceae bacterium]|nr:hypothetical protein [Bacteroidaceae bacterium]